MTQRTKSVLETIGIAFLVGALSAAAVTQYRIGQVEADLTWLKERVTDIYCATVPAGNREGCR